jgi:hypothetical protein
MEAKMYTAILFWISGILFTYGFNDKMFQDHEVSKKDRIAFALSFHLLFLWPLLLGDNIRRILEKSDAQKEREW